MDKCQVAPDGRHLWVEDGQTDNPGCRHCGVPAYGDGRIRGVVKTQAFTGLTHESRPWVSHKGYCGHEWLTDHPETACAAECPTCAGNASQQGIALTGMNEEAFQCHYAARLERDQTLTEIDRLSAGILARERVPGNNAQIVSLTRFVEEQAKVADLQRELMTLRARLAERDASLAKALKRSV